MEIESANWQIHAEVSQAVRFNVWDAADRIKRLLRTGAWRKFWIQNQRVGDERPVEHERFTDYVSEEPPRGLGTTVDHIKRLCGEDLECLDEIDQALQRPHGGARSKNDNIILDPSDQGTSRQGALRRLRKDRPDLHAQVLAGEKSAHAAMVEAGFRKKTITVPAHPADIAKTLRRHLDDNQIAELIKLLLA